MQNCYSTLIEGKASLFILSTRPSDRQSSRQVARIRIDKSRFLVATLDLIEAKRDIPRFA